jgi:CRP/FNR family cyclic AMP-dependent transcriptional regulator
MPMEKIRTLPLFDNLTPDEFDSLAKHFEKINFKTGEMIASEGEDCSEPLFLLTSGIVQVFKQLPTEDDKLLATLTAPTIVGELELLTDIPYSASLKAEHDVHAHIFPRKLFYELKDKGDTGIMKVIFNMAKNIGHATLPYQ